MNVFGENLRKIRIQKGLSQDELAQLLGTSKQVISRYENNQRSPKVSVVADYAEKLGVSIETLTSEHDNGYFSFKSPEADNIVQALGSDSPAAKKLRAIGDQLAPSPLLKEIGEALGSSPELKEMNRAMLQMSPEERQKMVEMGKVLFPRRFSTAKDD